MGMRTWAEDGSVRVPSRKETILSQLEVELKKTTPEFNAVMETWARSKDEKEKAQYSAYAGFRRLAAACHNERTGLLDILDWNRNIPNYVKGPHDARRLSFAKARCAIKHTPLFQVGFESQILEGGLGEFIEPPEHYNLFERRNFIWKQLGLRITRVKLGDRRLQGENTQLPPRASDLLARSFIYHWMQGLETWLRACKFTEFWSWPTGIQSQKSMNIGEIMEVEWGLFWDELGAVVWDCFAVGNYDEYMVLSLMNTDTTFEIDETNPELVKSSPALELDKKSFSTRRIIFATAFDHRRRPRVAELALGYPMVPRPRGNPSLPTRNPSRQPSRWDLPWTHRR